MTVVDAASIFEQLDSMDTLVDRGWHEVEGDERTVAHLLCDQLEVPPCLRSACSAADSLDSLSPLSHSPPLHPTTPHPATASATSSAAAAQFADLLLVNKVDLVTETQRGVIEAFLRKINPTAEIVCTEHSALEPTELLGKARFSMQKAEEHPEWLSEAREGEHTPESLEYGIMSFIFRAKRPFHPERLQAALGSRPRSGALAGLLRLKGFAWLATRPETQAHAALAGTQFTMLPGPPWMVAIPSGSWPEELKDEIQRELLAAEQDPAGYHTWDAEFGDRRTELVCIGREIEPEAASEQLAACLLTTEEMAAGEESWLALADPFAPSWEAMGGSGGGGNVEASQHQHQHQDDQQQEHANRVGQLANEMMSGATEANLRGIMALAKDHVLPPRRYSPRVSDASPFTLSFVVLVPLPCPALPLPLPLPLPFACIRPCAFHLSSPAARASLPTTSSASSSKGSSTSAPLSRSRSVRRCCVGFSTLPPTSAARSGRSFKA